MFMHHRKKIRDRENRKEANLKPSKTILNEDIFWLWILLFFLYTRKDVHEFIFKRNYFFIFDFFYVHMKLSKWMQGPNYKDLITSLT